MKKGRGKEENLSSANTRLPSVGLDSGLPRSIGGYTIRRIIGSGGMGTVYEAVQENPKRSVAVKVMNVGVSSPSALRRFEYEAQLLGRLSHPHIAQIYEAGTHRAVSGAVPFFAMEYIPNALPITDYAVKKDLGQGGRLELFAMVCEAIHHGHQKGIVHRDLKPANILIDSAGQPKIIDFGVARATDSDLAQPGLQTSVGELVGTVQYMSPEQCDADPHDIDTRSDVYSLGVVLFELLCGELPYDVTSVSLQKAIETVKQGTVRDPQSLKPAISRDLKTIMLKALEKDRERRYASASGLARDLRNFLSGDAIEARPASLAYQTKIFARRNKALMLGLASVILALSAGLIASSMMYVEAQQARFLAETQNEKARAALAYMQGMIFSIDPMDVGDHIRVGDLLDAYQETVGAAFPDEPETEAIIRSSIASLYQGLDLFEDAGKAEQYRRSAREQFAAALELRESALGEDHPDTLSSMDALATAFANQNRYADAERIALRAGAIRAIKLGPGHPETLSNHAVVAGYIASQGRLDEAETIAGRAVEMCSSSLGDDHDETLDTKAQMVDVKIQLGKLHEAETIQRELLGVRRRTGTEDSSAVRSEQSVLAAILIADKRWSEAADLYHDKPVPRPLRVERWLQGEADLAGDNPALLVFWEAW